MPRHALLAAILIALAPPTRSDDAPAGTRSIALAAGGWALLGDGTTLVVTSPPRREIVHLDSVTGEVLRTASCEFEPDRLVRQGERLLCSERGAPRVHVVEASTGRVVRTIALGSSGTVTSLAAHPSDGPAFAAAGGTVWRIDLSSGRAEATPARGEVLAVDPAAGRFLLAATNPPPRQVQNGWKVAPDGSLEPKYDWISDPTRVRKYELRGTGLSLSGENANASQGAGGTLHVSPDGSRYAFVAGGGWAEAEGTRRHYAAVFFSTGDVSERLSIVEVGAYPTSVAIHPAGRPGAIARSDGTILLFDPASLEAIRSFTLPGSSAGDGGLGLLFAGTGRTLVYQAGNRLHVVPLEAPPAESPTDGPASVVQLTARGASLGYQLADARPEASYLDGGDAKLAALPSALDGARLLVRPGADRQFWLEDAGALRCTREGMAYAAIAVRFNGVLRVADEDLADLEAEGWRRIHGTFRVAARDSMEWVVLGRPIRPGPVDLAVRTRLSSPEIVFAFGDGTASPPKAPEAPPSRPSAEEPPADRTGPFARVVGRAAADGYRLETAGPGTRYLADDPAVIAELPEPLAGAQVLVRNKRDRQFWLDRPGEVEVSRDGPVHAAIAVRLNGVERVDDEALADLEAEGWDRVAGRFAVKARDEMEWVVLTRRVRRGPLALATRARLNAPEYVFFLGEGAPLPVAPRPEAGERPADPSEPTAKLLAPGAAEGYRLEPAGVGTKYLSDDTAVIEELPESLAGAQLLVRKKWHRQFWLDRAGELSCAREGTAYVAIAVRLNGVERVTDEQLAELEAVGWERLPGRFAVKAYDRMDWVVMARKVRAGALDLATPVRINAPQYVFFFR